MYDAFASVDVALRAAQVAPVAALITDGPMHLSVIRNRRGSHCSAGWRGTPRSLRGRRWLGRLCRGSCRRKKPQVSATITTHMLQCSDSEVWCLLELGQGHGRECKERQRSAKEGKGGRARLRECGGPPLALGCGLLGKVSVLGLRGPRGGPSFG